MSVATDPWIQQQQEEAGQQARWERAEKRAAALDAGYASLGFAQLPVKDNGMLTGYQWTKRRPEQVAGLPPAVVARARDALAAEQAARDALMTRYQEARTYISKHQLSDAAARTHAELHSAEQATAFREASAQAQRAVLQLGEIAQAVQQARAVLSQVDARRQAIERTYQQQLAALTRDEQNARQALAQMGAE